ncbi:kinase-like domain-containing protein [Xylaria arbuscula]|nr:kinase-like domain-containing protein [Xylaria arbuscula]
MSTLSNDTSARVRRTVRFRERQYKDVFTGEGGWEFEKILGHGAFGLTTLLKDKDPLHIRRNNPRRYPRRVVLKRPLVADRDVQDFYVESKELEALRGHAHIAHLVDYTHTVEIFRSRAGRTADFLRRILRRVTNPPENIFKSLAYHDGPAIILDYLDNGPLLDFVARQRHFKIQLPNRLLWSLMHCMVRFCVGMTQRKAAPYDAPLQLEVPTEEYDEDSWTVTHNDIAARNIMIGDYEPDVPEHRIAPKLVLIDFGMADHRASARQSELYNLQQVMHEMMWLILPRVDMKTARECEGSRTHAWELYPRNGRNRAPNLDPQLRALLRDGMYEEFQERPSLREMFARTSIGAGKPATAYGAREPDETDQAIRQVVQQLLYDADPPRTNAFGEIIARGGLAML